MPPLDPDVSDLAPSEPELTPYDHEHAVTYMRMLDADAEGADWREVARIVLHIDSEREPAWARRAFDTGSVGDFQLPTAAGDDVAFALGGQAIQPHEHEFVCCRLSADADKAFFVSVRFLCGAPRQ